MPLSIPQMNLQRHHQVFRMALVDCSIQLKQIESRKLLLDVYKPCILRVYAVWESNCYKSSSIQPWIPSSWIRNDINFCSEKKGTIVQPKIEKKDKQSSIFTNTVTLLVTTFTVQLFRFFFFTFAFCLLFKCDIPHMSIK